MSTRTAEGTQYEIGQSVKVLCDHDWLPGTIVNWWNRRKMDRTSEHPEGGGPVVHVPDSPYRNKTFQASWEQVRLEEETQP